MKTQNLYGGHSIISMSDDLVIIYDGDCPFCSSYVKLLRLKSRFKSISIINARDGGGYVEDALNIGLNLDDGMAIKYQDAWIHGDECIHFLAIAAERENVPNIILSWLFASKSRSRALYPFLRWGRNITLKILGRKKLMRNNQESSEK